MKYPKVVSIKNSLNFWREINPIIRVLIFSDIMTAMTRLGFVAPVFAVYIMDRIPGGNLEVVGIATTIYMLSKSFLQIPISAVIDKIKGEQDDFWAVFIGTAWVSLTPLLYIYVGSVFQLYLIQFLLGVSAALSFPSWMAIFTRHIDHEHEGIEWGIYFTLIDLGGAVAATLGGIIAFRFGFDYLFILAGLVSAIGTLFLLVIRKDFTAVKNKLVNGK